MKRYTDDYTMVDGIPKWVWRLDDDCAHLAMIGENTLREVPVICRAEAIERKVPEVWLGEQLAECRRRRNEIVVSTG